MSKELGLVTLINAALTTSLPGAVSGFAVMTPENYISKANPLGWVYRSILNRPMYALSGQNALMNWEVQLDCLGFSMYHAIKVSTAIQAALFGPWRGTFNGGTIVAGIFSTGEEVSGINDDNRTFVISLSYNVHYYLQIS